MNDRSVDWNIESLFKEKLDVIHRNIALIGQIIQFDPTHPEKTKLKPIPPETHQHIEKMAEHLKSLKELIEQAERLHAPNPVAKPDFKHLGQFTQLMHIRTVMDDVKKIHDHLTQQPQLDAALIPIVEQVLNADESLLTASLYLLKARITLHADSRDFKDHNIPKATVVEHYRQVVQHVRNDLENIQSLMNTLDLNNKMHANNRAAIHEYQHYHHVFHNMLRNYGHLLQQIEADMQAHELEEEEKLLAEEKEKASLLRQYLNKMLQLKNQPHSSGYNGSNGT